jgi:hypothetical protein
MCHKVRVFKQFHAVMVTTSCFSAPRTLHVFKYNPSTIQVEEVVKKYVTGKPAPVSFIYSEKPQIHVVPIHISPYILF